MTIGKKISSAILLLIGLNLAGTHVSAQIIYSCDFEDATENKQWTVNKIGNSANLSSWKNIWGIGEPGNCASDSGLYIHPNQIPVDLSNTAIPIASTQNDFIVAYRDGIPVTPNTDYRISFDWKFTGRTTDLLYVYWIPDTYKNNTNSALNTAGAPGAISQFLLPNMPLRGSLTWQNYSGVPNPNKFTNTSITTGKLLFLWIQGAGMPNNPPAAIDNIEIAANVGCVAAPPTGLDYNGTALTWIGSAAAYDVRCCLDTRTNKWFTADSVVGNSCRISGVGEGWFSFQVRSRCDEGHSAWATKEDFVFTKGVRCIDVFDLDTAGTCYTGRADSGDYNAKKKKEKVDEGYQSENSRHTIHYVPGEMDPRTDNMLPTIPPGDIASVRLGNWKIGAEAEAIEYKLFVRAGTSDILKLRYAVVLEDGGHTIGGAEQDPHGSNEQSHFYVAIKDAQGNLQDIGCSTFNFSSDPEAVNRDPTWHLSSQNAVWKEWTDVSISLANYIGQVITIYLATYDCTAAGHYGYAYFTMSCENGQLEGVTCGDYRSDHFIAPEGFNYAWYKQGDPSHTILSTGRRYDIDPLDANIYMVDVINKVNNCAYTLTANPNPRFPMAEVTPTRIIGNCENKVRFSNTSHVVYRSKIDSTIMKKADEEVESVIWDFGDGSPVISSKKAVLEHMFPQEGGTFNVTVKATMNDEVCVDSIVIPLTLPKLGDQRIVTEEQYCYKGNNPYIYKGQPYTDSFSDSATVTLPTGCDSTGILNVKFVGVVESELRDTICGERTNYTYNGTVYPDSGTYKVLYEGASALGCDSIVTLRLYKHPVPKIQVDSAFAECADELVGLTLPYTLTDLDATIDSIHVRMGEEAVANGFAPSYDFAVNESIDITWPANISPNVYQGVVEFSSPWCTTYTYPFKIELFYPSSILDQKNGIIAVLNSATNGGFDFLSYQWYRNGERLDGETASYVRVSDKDDINADYYVVVLRQTDNVVLRSCPITYTGGRNALDNISASTQAVKVIENGILYIIRDGVYYSVLGTTVRTHGQD